MELETEADTDMTRAGAPQLVLWPCRTSIYLVGSLYHGNISCSMGLMCSQNDICLTYLQASSGGAAPVSLGAAGSSAAGYVSSGFTTGLTTSGNGPSTGSGSGSRPSSHPGSRPGSDSVSPACPATVQSACINASLAVGTSAVPERESDRNSSSRSPDTVRGDRETDCERLRNSSANYDLRRNLAGEYASARDISSNQMLTSAVAAHTSHESRDDDQSNPRLHIDDSAEQAVAVPATGISESQHVQSQHTLQGVSMDELAVSSRFNVRSHLSTAKLS